MTTKTATVRLDGEGSRFVARTGSGHTITIDSAEGDSGPRAAELRELRLESRDTVSIALLVWRRRGDDFSVS